MKVAVIGSREYDNYGKVKYYLDRLNSRAKITLIISGGARGADALGERWADENGVPKKIYEAEWDRLDYPDARIKVNARGKKYDANAGMRRNKDIIDNCDVAIAFHVNNSPGTANSIAYARKTGKKIFVAS